MQFIYCFQSEWLKKKRSLASWLVFIGAFFTPVIVIVARLVRHKTLLADSLSDKYWTALWNSSWESMAIFLLPTGIILAASLIAQLEYKNNTWKQLHATPQKFTTLYFAKMAVITVMVLQFFLLFNIGIYLSGVIPCLLVPGVHYPQAAIPYSFFLRENLLYFVDCLPIMALQYLISLQSKNFLMPVGGGIAMWIFSIAILKWEYGYVVPYTYCAYHYVQAQGRMGTGFSVHLLALIYFSIFTVAGYLFYVFKTEKG